MPAERLDTSIPTLISVLPPDATLLTAFSRIIHGSLAAAVYTSSPKPLFLIVTACSSGATPSLLVKLNSKGVTSMNV